MLRRHKQGEKGDYLSTNDNAMLTLISWGKCPSHFYKNRVVCEQCFKVYKLIDVERDKAMEKMHHKQDMAKAKRLGAVGAGTTSTAQRIN